MTIQPTDIYIVNRGGTNYKVPAADIGSKLEPSDFMLVNRSGSNYKITGADVRPQVNSGYLNSQSPCAQGGVVFKDRLYWNHFFYESGTFQIFVPSITDIEFFYIAGGGGGGAQTGGGGGGGASGRTPPSTIPLVPGPRNATIVVGAGGAGGTHPGGNGQNGNKTGVSNLGVFSTYDCSGGGGGGGGGSNGLAAAPNPFSDRNGPKECDLRGGGGGGGGNTYGSTSGGQGGRAGGGGFNLSGGGGGGGGAYAATNGQSAPPTSAAGNNTSVRAGRGGTGRSHDWPPTQPPEPGLIFGGLPLNSPKVDWSSGGGGGRNGPAVGGGGGSTTIRGFGGVGKHPNAPSQPSYTLNKIQDGVENTGSGGGGGGQANPGGNGASGLVIIRYPRVDNISNAPASLRENPNIE